MMDPPSVAQVQEGDGPGLPRPFSSDQRSILTAAVDDMLKKRAAMAQRIRKVEMSFLHAESSDSELEEEMMEKINHMEYVQQRREKRFLREQNKVLNEIQKFHDMDPSAERAYDIQHLKIELARLADAADSPDDWPSDPEKSVMSNDNHSAMEPDLGTPAAPKVVVTISQDGKNSTKATDSTKDKRKLDGESLLPSKKSKKARHQGVKHLNLDVAFEDKTGFSQQTEEKTKRGSEKNGKHGRKSPVAIGTDDIDIKEGDDSTSASTHETSETKKNRKKRKSMTVDDFDMKEDKDSTSASTRGAHKAKKNKKKRKSISPDISPDDIEMKDEDGAKKENLDFNFASISEAPKTKKHKTKHISANEVMDYENKGAESTSTHEASKKNKKNKKHNKSKFSCSDETGKEMKRDDNESTSSESAEATAGEYSIADGGKKMEQKKKKSRKQRNQSNSGIGRKTAGFRQFNNGELDASAQDAARATKQATKGLTRIDFPVIHSAPYTGFPRRHPWEVFLEPTNKKKPKLDQTHLGESSKTDDPQTWVLDNTGSCKKEAGAKSVTMTIGKVETPHKTEQESPTPTPKKRGRPKKAKDSANAQEILISSPQAQTYVSSFHAAGDLVRPIFPGEFRTGKYSDDFKKVREQDQKVYALERQTWRKAMGFDE